MLPPEIRARIEAISRHSAPLLVFPRSEPEIDGWLTGGTVGLVRTPLNALLITADHVVCEIEMLRKKREIVVLLGGTSAPPIDISDWPVIDRNPRLDVCIIQVPANFDPKTINKSFHEVNFAECVRVSVNDEAIIIGFPRAHRSAVGSVINTRMLPVIDFVRSVSEERFVIADENNERQVLINPSGLQVPEHMGGASGAPVFRLMLDAKFELIGIFTGGSDGLHGVYFCAHANFVSNTGHIDTLQLPSR